MKSIMKKSLIGYEKNSLVNIAKLYIPSNLTILATMNTSDQNVFTIDTAFKRRWRMHRIKNNFNNENNSIFKTIFYIKK